MEDVRKKRYIYEFDLKGFFDNVECGRVINYLTFHGLSPQFAEELTNMCKRFAKLPKIQPLDETNENRKAY